MATNLDTKLKTNQHIDKDEVLNNFLINDMFMKCKKYKNSIFETYDKYNYDTVYAIGDIHCDYEALIKILKHIDCIIKDDNIKSVKGGKSKHNHHKNIQQIDDKVEYKWNPKIKNTCIIQVGDITGRKHPKDHTIADTYEPKEIKIIKLLSKLADEALQYNSRIILLYGNHEIHKIFDIIDRKKLNKKLKDVHIEFSKLKDYILCNYHSVCIVNGYLFCHAGIILSIIQKLMELFNITEEQFVNLDISDKLFLINICVVGMLNGIISEQLDKDKIENIRAIVYDIFHNREYFEIKDSDDEINNLHKLRIMKNITETKVLYNIKGIIVGHNRTFDYKIHKFDDLYDIDIKISEGFGSDIKNEVNQILKIVKDKPPEIIEISNK